MKLLEGETLSAHIRAGESGFEAATVGDGDRDAEHPVSMQTVVCAPSTARELKHILGLIENIARTVHAAHEVGVIHRDIKPGNIMLTPDAGPILLLSLIHI